jgi:hypothetical protein
VALCFLFSDSLTHPVKKLSPILCLFVLFFRINVPGSLLLPFDLLSGQWSLCFGVQYKYLSDYGTHCAPPRHVGRGHLGDSCSCVLPTLECWMALRSVIRHERLITDV